MLRIEWHVLPLTLLCLALAAEPAVAQATGSVTGRVIDVSTRQPVVSARVSIAGIEAITLEDGVFRLERIPAGQHELLIRRIGFQVQRTTVSVFEGATARIEIAMTPIPTELPGVSVEAQAGTLGGFWERRERGLGKFMTRADLDSRKPYKLVDMFRGVEGARIVPTVHGYGVASQRGSRALSGEECMAAVFVNGVPFQMSSAGLNDLDPDNVEAIEYYSSSARIPAQFNVTGGGSSARTGFISGNPKCGVVAVWLRGRR